MHSPRWACTARRGCTPGRAGGAAPARTPHPRAACARGTPVEECALSPVEECALSPVEECALSPVEECALSPVEECALSPRPRRSLLDPTIHGSAGEGTVERLRGARGPLELGEGEGVGGEGLLAVGPLQSRHQRPVHLLDFVPPPLSAPSPRPRMPRPPASHSHGRHPT